MLVLIQVSSMKTSLRGSSCPMKPFQRRRLRATSARLCSMANSVFFEAEALALKEMPHRIVRDKNISCAQPTLQAMQRQMRRVFECTHDTITLGIKFALAVSAHPGRCNAACLPISPVSYTHL